MISSYKSCKYLVFLKLKCIELYKNYILKWDAIKFENQDDYDLVPSEIYFISITNALNRKVAIKEGKRLFFLKCLSTNRKIE